LGFTSRPIAKKIGKTMESEGIDKNRPIPKPLINAKVKPTPVLMEAPGYLSKH